LTDIEKDNSEEEDDKVVSDDGSDKEKTNENMFVENEDEKNVDGSDDDNKDQVVDDIVNVEDLNYDDEPIGRRLTPCIAKKVEE